MGTRQLQALFFVGDILERRPDGETTAQIVRMNATYENRPDHPNYAFWKATPTASLEMTINNSGAFDFFKGGKKYLLTFEEVED